MWLTEIGNHNGARMTYRCIGQRKINNHRTDRTELVRCTVESETPNNPNRPEWGFLCLQCSGEAPKGPKVYEEPLNLSAMQCDPSEYRDQIAAGFASGARRGYEDSSEGDDE